MALRALAPALVLVLLLAGCVQPGLTPGALLPTNPLQTTSLAFTPLVSVDAAKYGSEPSIAVDSKGHIYVSAPAGLGRASYLWKSEDNGTTWKQLDYNAFKLPNGQGLGGGDTSIALGPDDSVWVTDLWVGSSTVSVSKDGGKTWLASPIGSPVPYNDREWNTVDSKGHGYYLGRTFTPAIAAWVSRTDDGGLTWVHAGNPWIAAPGADDANLGRQDGSFITNPKTDAIGVVYSCATRAVCVSTSSDLGVSWTPVVAARGEKAINNVFPTMAADADGNWYVSYAEGDNEGVTIKMATSTDGKTWSEPINVTTTAATRLMPWMVAGDAGRVAISWYETDTIANSNDVTAMKEATWNVALAVATNGLDAAPTFDIANVSDAPIHKGTISTRGLNPNDPNPPDRGLGDFFMIALDPHGKVHLSFGIGSRGGDKFQTVHAAQTAGPSLYVEGHKSGADHAEETGPRLIPALRLGR